MEINSLFLSVLFVALPGIVAAKLYWTLTGYSGKKDWHDLLEIFLFSLAAYSVYAVCAWIAHIVQNPAVPYVGLAIADLLSDGSDPKIHVLEILRVSLTAIPIAFLASYFYQHKLWNRLGHLLKATARYGDQDLWDYFHNIKNIEWVFVRDHKLELTYFCWIAAFSDSEKARELILKDVRVHSNQTSECLYEVPLMYLSRNSDDLSIEVVPKEEVKCPKKEEPTVASSPQ